jgi:hypothetical protein
MDAIFGECSTLGRKNISDTGRVGNCPYPLLNADSHSINYILFMDRVLHLSSTRE